jgi:hypothetical protein
MESDDEGEEEDDDDVTSFEEEDSNDEDTEVEMKKSGKLSFAACSWIKSLVC